MDLFIFLTLTVVLGIVRFLTLFFHELGHALPALKYTRMPVSMYIGSFGDEDNCIKLSHGLLDIYIKRNPLLWYRGLCISDGSYMTLRQTAIQVLAGPFFSLLVAAISVTMAILFDMHGAFRFIFGMFLIFATADLFYNLYPRTFGTDDYMTVKSDGRVLLDLFHDWREERAMLRGRKKKKKSNSLRKV